MSDKREHTNTSTLAPPPAVAQPTQVHLTPSPSLDRNLTFQLEQGHQRGRSYLGRQHGGSNPGSRANSRSRTSRPNSKSGSRPGSRPVSWLVSANSDYTSIYENYGGYRSRRTSDIDEGDIASAIEKGAGGKMSRSSSHAPTVDEKNIPLDPTRPGIVSQHPSNASTLLHEDGNSIDSNDEPPRGNVSALRASLLLLKAFVGTGVLFLPNAFRNGGLLFSCITLAVVAFICCFAFLLLVKVRLIVRENFQDMGFVLYGKWMRLTVLWAVALSQMGFVCAYLIFVSQNLFAVVQTLTKCQFTGIQEKFYILIPLVVLVPLVLIRRMAILSLPSMLANVFIIIGIVYIWYISIDSLAQHGMGPEIQLFNSESFALFLGTAVFSYEGIGLIIPITESMAEPEKFPRVLAITMTIVTCIFACVGALCYSAFGSNVQTIVLMNLPVTSGMTITVEILYSCAIILSVPLMLSPASKIIENAWWGEKSGSRSLKVKMQKNTVRTLLILICALVAFGVGGPSLDIFVSLIGSVACMPLCFIFPALFHYKACAKTWKAKAMDIALGVLGVAAMIFTLYITIHSWVDPAEPHPELDRCTAFTQ
ncbi:neutral amino acid transporter [Mortierella hygrophila]|uniref:Neutral amino acid transporter n=1 Tax=Mortierella hygrophila TaxID=979708 RepID=A0A9P6K4U1_9FUNG|nr:neutral amino acid transporter [Mortierella hygrophila]